MSQGQPLGTFFTPCPPGACQAQPILAVTSSVPRVLARVSSSPIRTLSLLQGLQACGLPSTPRGSLCTETHPPQPQLTFGDPRVRAWLGSTLISRHLLRQPQGSSLPAAVHVSAWCPSLDPPPQPVRPLENPSAFHSQPPWPPHLPWPPKCPRRPLLKPPHPTTGQAVFLPAPGVLLPAWELAWQAPGCTGPARRWGTGDNREADRTRELLEGTAAPRGRTQARMGPDQVTMWRRHLMGTCPCSVQNCSALGTASPLVTSAPPTLPPSTQAHACPRAFAPAARLASSAFPADLLGAPSFSSMLVGAQ